jgi:hypothetical protein
MLLRTRVLASNLLLSTLLTLSLGKMVVPCLAFAQEKPTVKDEATTQAKKAFVEGQKEFKKSNYKNAIDLWEKAYELKPLPLLLYNISLAYERLGDKEAALLYAQRYLDAQPQDDPLAGQVKGNIEGLAKTIERPLTINADPSDAQIIVDDGAPLTSSTEILLALGEHKIKIVKDGYETQEQTVTVWLDPLFPLTIKLTMLRYDVHIKGLPVGAQVKLNGEIIPDPRTLVVPKGSQVIEISAVGYQPFRKEFLVTGEKDVVVADLEPLPRGVNKLLLPAGFGAGALVFSGVGALFTLRARSTFFVLDQNPELRTKENINLGRRQALAADFGFGGAALCLAGAAAFLVVGQLSEKTTAQLAIQPDGAMLVWQGALQNLGAN